MTQNKLILGLNVLGHDSSVAVVSECGDICIAISEERFSNIKHDPAFPVVALKKSIDAVRKNNLGTVAHIAINFDPKLYICGRLKKELFKHVDFSEATSIYDKITKTLSEAVVCSDGAYPMNYISAFEEWGCIREPTRTSLIKFIKFTLNTYFFKVKLVDNISGLFPGAKIHCIPHHMCHAVSAFHCSGFRESAILTIDGYGEHATSTQWLAGERDLALIRESLWPHSLGLLYSMVSKFLGYSWYGDEYKVMGMSAYGVPRYLEVFKQICSVSHLGELSFLKSAYTSSTEMPGSPGVEWCEFSSEFYRVLGRSRSPSEPLIQKHFDIAASVQRHLEDCGVMLAAHLKEKAPSHDSLCLAGGVCLNGLMNEAIRTRAGFKNIFVQPASTDEGTALGAALYVARTGRNAATASRIQNMFLGFDYSELEVHSAIENYGLDYQRSSDISSDIAGALADGRVVARFVGRSEFGPRALGARSILAPASIQDMKCQLNKKVKYREPFRPFAPAILEDFAHEFSDLPLDSEYMLLIARLKDGVLNKIPAVVHADYTARVQVVSKNNNRDLYDIISKYNELTSVPVLINTSFNVNGETMVESPTDAIECFLWTNIDYLAIGNYWISGELNKERKINCSLDEFLERRRSRYRERLSGRDSYWSSNLGEVQASESELVALAQRRYLRNVASMLVNSAERSSCASFVLYGGGDLGSEVLRAAANRLNILAVVDRGIFYEASLISPRARIYGVCADAGVGAIVASIASEEEILQFISDSPCDRYLTVLTPSAVISEYATVFDPGQ